MTVTVICSDILMLLDERNDFEVNIATTIKDLGVTANLVDTYIH